MATLNAVQLTSKVNKNGESPVVIQITHNYKTRRVTLFSIEKRFFKDGKVSRSHKDFAKHTNAINRALSHYQERIDRLEASGIPYHVDDIMAKDIEMPSLLTELVRSYGVRQMDLNKKHSARVMRNIADSIDDFDPRTRVSDVNVSWLDRYANFLRNRDGIGSDSTVGKYIKNLKTALRSDLTDFFDKSVFNYKNPKSEAEIEALTLEEMKIWQGGIIPERLEIYRDFFTFMVHCQGPRVTDALIAESKSIKNGYINFREQKTGARKGYGKIKKVAVNGVLSNLINKYAGMSRYYIFPFVEMAPDDPKTNAKYSKHISSKIATINKNLKLVAAHLGIDKKVTNHVARHTFASLADSENIDVRDIQRMLNHSKLEQTIQYIHRIREADKLNEQAQKVLDRLT